MVDEPCPTQEQPPLVALNLVAVSKNLETDESAEKQLVPLEKPSTNVPGGVWCRRETVVSGYAEL